MATFHYLLIFNRSNYYSVYWHINQQWKELEELVAVLKIISDLVPFSFWILVLINSWGGASLYEGTQIAATVWDHIISYHLVYNTHIR